MRVPRKQWDANTRFGLILTVGSIDPSMIINMWDFLNGCDAECSGATTEVLRKMGGDVRDQHLCSGLGADCWVWIRWLGEHDKFHSPDWHIRALHKMLPMPTASNASFTTTSRPQRHRGCSSTPPFQPHSQPLIRLNLQGFPSWLNYNHEYVIVSFAHFGHLCYFSL